jgi:hypothetical protein
MRLDSYLVLPDDGFGRRSPKESAVMNGADRRGAVPPSFPGPGLSAIDMAAACLCLAESVWDADAIEPPVVDGRAGPVTVRARDRGSS